MREAGGVFTQYSYFVFCQLQSFSSLFPRIHSSQLEPRARQKSRAKEASKAKQAWVLVALGVRTNGHPGRARRQREPLRPKQTEQASCQGWKGFRRNSCVYACMQGTDNKQAQNGTVGRWIAQCRAAGHCSRKRERTSQPSKPASQRAVQSSPGQPAHQPAVS